MLGGHWARENGQVERIDDVWNRTNADAPRKSLNTSTTAGRECGFSLQQWFISLHKSAVQSGCTGRGGWAPFIISNMAAVFGLSLKGTAPVNTCIDVRRRSGQMKSFTTCLHHNHGKRENVCFLAMCPIFQDLWCCPSRGETITVNGSIPYGIQVLRDLREAKICDPWVSGVVHEDVLLADVNEIAKQASGPHTPLRSP